MNDNRTAHLNIPLPDPDNFMRSEDVPRLIQALQIVDAAIKALPTKGDIDQAIATLVGSAPANLDTIAELADALRDDANFATTVMNALALKANLSALAALAMSGDWKDLAGRPSSYPPPIASSTVVGGIKIGAGLVLGGDGTVSTAGSGGGTGLPAWQDVIIRPAADNQTVFAPEGGYPLGQIDLIKNGSTLVGNGDDYTASNGSSITLSTPANKVDTLVLRKWFYLPAANAINKTGDRMTGYLEMPANATGAQAPQAQEVVRKSGDEVNGKLALKGSATALACVLTNAAEKVTIMAAAAAGTVNLDVTTQAQIYYSNAATANWTLNVRGNADNTLNSLLEVGQSTTVSFWAKQGATAFLQSAIQVDGAAITPVWQGTVAPTAGTPSGIDIYTVTITKTGNAAFLVFASFSPFK